MEKKKKVQTEQNKVLDTVGNPVRSGYDRFHDRKCDHGKFCIDH